MNREKLKLYKRGIATESCVRFLFFSTKVKDKIIDHYNFKASEVKALRENER